MYILQAHPLKPIQFLAYEYFSIPFTQLHRFKIYNTGKLLDRLSIMFKKF